MKTNWHIISTKFLLSCLRCATCVFLLAGCLSSIVKTESQLALSEKKVRWEDTADDYLDHYNELIKTFVTVNANYVRKASFETERYLNSFWFRIFASDKKEGKRRRLSIYYYDDQQPFFILSPDGKLILSVGLIDKYIINQSLLSIILLESTLRLKYKIFFKTEFIPTGNMTVRQALQILKIDLASKTNLNKWIYHYFKKNDKDAGSLLDWVQVRNKNSLDFSLLNSFGYNPLKEEKLLKRMLLNDKNIGLVNEESSLSPKVFYNFRAEVTKDIRK